ncbi:hypothetical protein QE152_g13813 [Popillia japonica]|uniref:Uncharacterized protein n=1 Tax=Popillia japonica TaxID=7064 RepID=A0AAW1LB92_POPJA
MDVIKFVTISYSQEINDVFFAWNKTARVIAMRIDEEPNKKCTPWNKTARVIAMRIDEEPNKKCTPAKYEISTHQAIFPFLFRFSSIYAEQYIRYGFSSFQLEGLQLRDDKFSSIYAEQYIRYGFSSFQLEGLQLRDDKNATVSTSKCQTYTIRRFTFVFALDRSGKRLTTNLSLIMRSGRLQ